MHPDAAFEWTDEAEMLAFVSAQAFATIATDGPAIAHAPLTVEGRKVSFHLARRNRISDRVDGARIVASVVGVHGYQSANWYASADQVPTWLYESVEIEGIARKIDSAALVAQVDALSEAMEAIHSPENVWTRDKMSDGKFDAMIKAIVGFTIEVEALRGTRKFNQHKPDADIAAAIAGQSGAGRPDIVAAIRERRK